MSKRTTSLILGLLANVEAQNSDFNLLYETNNQDLLGYTLRQKNLAVDSQSMLEKVNENILKRQKEIMQEGQDQQADSKKPHKKKHKSRRDDIPESNEDLVPYIDALANNMDENALGETWGPGDHKKYKKHRKRRDRKNKYRNLEQYELDKEDEEERRKAYDSELTRKEDAKKAREDLKRKQIEQEEKDRLEKE